METLFSNKSWFLKYKLHHLAFWASYHFIFWTAYEGSALRILEALTHPYLLLKYLSYVVFQALGVYFCLYFLIPRFLIKGKYLAFLSLLTFTIVAIAAFIYSGYHMAGWVAGKDVRLLFNLGDKPVSSLFYLNSLPSSLASMTLGMSIKLAKNYVESQRRQQELEKEKLETELKFLKSQFNPHFLFNTINSIFVLINKNKDLAAESLAKFSGLLRYQLYECNEPKIPLNRELAYLESFIELEKLRRNANFEIETNLLLGYAGSHNIAPFVLMPFIENAFKHVSQKPDQVNWIKIVLSMQKEELTFQISNSFYYTEESSRDAANYNGLGLKNVKRRLDLLYPNEHQLFVEKNPESYMLHLKMTLSTVHESELKLIES